MTCMARDDYFSKYSQLTPSYAHWHWANNSGQALNSASFRSWPELASAAGSMSGALVKANIQSLSDVDTVVPSVSVLDKHSEVKSHGSTFVFTSNCNDIKKNKWAVIERRI